jgi:hypothetical protein
MSAPPPECEPSYKHCPVVDDVKETKVDVKRIYMMLAGNEKTPGILTRIDRLERDSARRTWWTRAAAVALLSLIGQQIAKLFR